MPSSLTMAISRALGFSPHPPVSVYGTVTIETPYEDFLGSVVGLLLADCSAMVSCFDLTARRIFLSDHAYALSPPILPGGKLTLLRPSLGNNASIIVPEY